jgi:hypothetical protein
MEGRNIIVFGNQTYHVNLEERGASERSLRSSSSRSSRKAHWGIRNFKKSASYAVVTKKLVSSVNPADHIIIHRPRCTVHLLATLIRFLFCFRFRFLDISQSLGQNEIYLESKNRNILIHKLGYSCLSFPSTIRHSTAVQDSSVSPRRNKQLRCESNYRSQGSGTCEKASRNVHWVHWT